jgi:hypothetical protein
MNEESKEITATIESTLMSDEAIKLLFAKLREPIEPRWRVQNSKGGKYATVVPYIDARAVQDRLDEVLSPENWQNTLEIESGTASLSIKINGEWISKSDIGTDSNVEKEKGKASDAFKRAAVLWGIGRNLYHIGTKSIQWNEEKKCPVTPKGELLNTATKLSLYMNGMNTSLGLLSQLWSENKELQADETFKDLVVKLKSYVK